ncbi:PIN domain-containing protein [Chryseoglobus sp. 28M-23]
MLDAHADPFDRMLAAQAAAEGLPLATVDRVFDEAAGVTVVWD